MKFEVITWVDDSDPDAEELPQKWGVKVTGNNGTEGVLSEGGTIVEFDTPADAQVKVDEMRERHGGIS